VGSPSSVKYLRSTEAEIIKQRSRLELDTGGFFGDGTDAPEDLKDLKKQLEDRG